MVEAKEITIENLLDEVKYYHDSGYRFVTTTCIDMGDKFQIYYHFDKDMKLENLKLIVDKNTRVPSISSIYFCSILSENEMQDMFGIEFDGLVVDYGGKFLLGEDSPLTPQAHIQVIKKPSAETAEDKKGEIDKSSKESDNKKGDSL